MGVYSRLQYYNADCNCNYKGNYNYYKEHKTDCNIVIPYIRSLPLLQRTLKTKPNMNTLKKYCQICDSEFEATRSDAKYCSDACKQQAYRNGIKISYSEN